MPKKIFALLLTIIMLALPSANILAVEIPAVEPKVVIMPEPEKEKIIEEPYYYDPTPVSEESELAAAILTFKEIFGATDEYKEFYHYVSINYGKKIYDLNWSSSDKDGYKSMYSGVGVDGIIYSYDTYNNNWYRDYIRIPKISKDEAIDTAYDFISVIAPNLIDSISKDYAEITYSTYNDTYSMTFYRIENNIVIGNEYITVSVSSEGKIINYSRYSMSNNVAKTDLVTSLSKTDILNSMKKNLPFELAYQIVYPNGYDKLAEVKLVYKLPYDYRTKVFDAATGKMLNVQGTTYYPRVAATGANDMVAEEVVSTAPQSVYLTPVEIAAVELDESFLTVEEITKMLVDNPALQFTSDYYVVTSRLNKNKSIYTDVETYYWNISYRNKDGDSAYADVDAETGVINNFNFYTNNYIYRYANEFEKSFEDCYPIAEKYLKELYPDIFDEYVYEPYIYYNEYMINYSYNFYRYVNGIKFSDAISITLDPDTQLITSVYMNYSDAKFPSLDNIISKDNAVDRYWSKFDLKPTYLIYDNLEDETIFTSYQKISDYEKYLLLIYRYNYSYSIDAKTGKVVDYSFAELLRENIPAENYHVKGGFTDITKHKYEEAIVKLYNMDFINSTSNKFKPDTAIKYEEFMNILAFLGRYYYRPLSNTEQFKNETILTRADAIKIFIDQLGFGKVAELKGIFNTDYFTDSDKISDDLIGYAAIAKGLGILELFGDKISPDTRLTKAEAVQMVYTYILNSISETN